MRVRLLSLSRRGVRVVEVRGVVCSDTDDGILEPTVVRHERVWVVPR